MNKKKGHGWVQEVTNQSGATTDLNTFSLQPKLSVTYLIPWSQQMRSWSQSATENKTTEENRREGKRLEEKRTRQNKREGKVSEGQTNAENRSEGGKQKKEEKRVRCSKMHCIYFRETDTKSAIQTFLTQGQFIFPIKTGWRQAKIMRCKCDVFLVIQHTEEVGLVSNLQNHTNISYKFKFVIKKKHSVSTHRRPD